MNTADTNMANNTNSELQEDFKVLVSSIKSFYKEDELSEAEACQAGRNLIQFVEIMSKYGGVE